MAESGAAKSQAAEKLGYLGLGLMGAPMTRRLLAAGHKVTVWNRSSGKAASLVEAGAKRAADPSEVAAAADIIFMCVTDAVAVEEVIFGAGVTYTMAEAAIGRHCPQLSQLWNAIGGGQGPNAGTIGV